MPIRYDNNKIGKIFYNNNKIKKAYLGVNQVFTNKIPQFFLCSSSDEENNVIRSACNTWNALSMTKSTVIQCSDVKKIKGYIVIIGKSRSNSSHSAISVCDSSGREVYKETNATKAYNSICYNEYDDLVYIATGKTIEAKRLDKKTGILENVFEKQVPSDIGNSITKIEMYNDLVLASCTYETILLDSDIEKITNYSHGVRTFNLITLNDNYFIIKSNVLEVYLFKINPTTHEIQSLHRIDITELGEVYRMALGNDNHIYVDGKNGIAKLSYSSGILKIIKQVNKDYGYYNNCFIANNPYGTIYVTNSGSTIMEYDYELNLLRSKKMEFVSRVIVIDV